MSGLVSLNKVKILKDDLRCLKCIVFNTIVNASQVWNVKDGVLERCYYTVSKDCKLVKLFFDGKTPDKEDIELMNNCDDFILCESWDAFDKNFVDAINNIIEYIYLTTMQLVRIENIVSAYSGLKNRIYNRIDPLLETKNEDINRQFLSDCENYLMLEEVRQLFANTSV